VNPLERIIRFDLICVQRKDRGVMSTYERENKVSGDMLYPREEETTQRICVKVKGVMGIGKMVEG